MTTPSLRSIFAVPLKKRNSGLYPEFTKEPLPLYFPSKQFNSSSPLALLLMSKKPLQTFFCLSVFKTKLCRPSPGFPHSAVPLIMYVSPLSLTSAMIGT